MPSDQGCTAILLIIDFFPNILSHKKWRNEMASTIHKHFMHYFTTFGIPQMLLTDQGGQF